jgi:hypothetical protein
LGSRFNTSHQSASADAWLLNQEKILKVEISTNGRKAKTNLRSSTVEVTRRKKTIRRKSCMCQAPINISQVTST